MRNETGKITSFCNFRGDGLYQQRARIALPILVRQALLSQQITYSDLASELKMPNPRNLNYVLGLIGNTLKELSKEWGEEIPYIQRIVVNKDTGMPGDGFKYFINDNTRYDEMNPSEKKQVLSEMLHNIFRYGKWYDVLENLGLKPNDNQTATFKKTLANNADHGYSSGESEKHKQFKTFISEHPELIKLKGFNKGSVEHTFPSQDAIDVYFSNDKMVVGVEVKSEISDTKDILRGLFQCVKYESLIEAENKVLGERKEIKVILALKKSFPDELMSIKNILSVNVIDNISNDT